MFAQLWVLSKIFTIILLTVSLTSCGESNLSNKPVFSISRSLDANSVSITKNIILEFTNKLQISTINSSNIYILDENNSVFKSNVKVYDNNISKIIIVPYKYFSPSSSYKIVVNTALEDVNGDSLHENYVHSFVTKKRSAKQNDFKVLHVKPSDNTANVDVHSCLSIEFTNPISQENNPKLRLKNSQNEIVAGKNILFNTTISFCPDTNLQTNELYTLNFQTPPTDMYAQQYDIAKQASEWSFYISDVNASATEKGFSIVSVAKLIGNANLVTTISDAPSNSLVVEATENSLSLYRVSYSKLPKKPTLTLLQKKPTKYQINSINALDDTYILVATVKNGIHLFNVDTNISEIATIKTSENIFKIYGKNNKIYTVGIKDGLNIYDFDASSKTISLRKHIRANSSVMLDVLQINKTIYVADYNGAVLSYAEDGTFLKEFKINRTINRLAYRKLDDSILALSYSGVVNAIRLADGSLVDENIELPYMINSIYSTQNGSKIITMSNELGINIVDASLYKESDAIVKIPNISSATVVNDSEHNIAYILFATKDGFLKLQNLTSDVLGTQITSLNIANGDNVDLNASINIQFKDVHLDINSFTKDKFMLKDTTKNTLLDYNLKLVYTNSELTATVTPKKEFIDKELYSLVIQESILDMIGNRLDGGTRNIEFTGHAYQSARIDVSSVVSVKEGATADYVVSLNRVALKDLMVNLEIVNTETKSSDFTNFKSSYTILKGSQSITIPLATFDDNIYENNESFALKITTVSGGGFDKVDINSSAESTIIVDNDAKPNISINDVSTRDDASPMQVIISLDRPASSAIYVDYNTSNGSAVSGSDYSATNARATIPAGETQVVISIPLVNDGTYEGNENFYINLSNNSSNSIIKDAQGYEIIIETTAAPVTTTQAPPQ